MDTGPKKLKACFTLQHNEQFYLPIWIKWYRRTFEPEDMYILAHNTTEPTLSMLRVAEAMGINVIYLNTEVIFDHDWLNEQVHGMQRQLLEKYKWVMFMDCDELVEPVEGTLSDFIDNATEPAYRCDGWELHEKEKMYRSIGFCKTSLSQIPLTYVHGYHRSEPEFPVDERLRLYHIHKISWDEAWARNQRISAEKWDAFALQNGLGTHNNISGEQDFRDWWVRDLPAQEHMVDVPQDLLDRILKNRV